MNRTHIAMLLAAKAALGASLVLGFGTMPAASAEWSCVDDGDRVCLPNNTEGKPAACYDDGGVIAAYWPCSPWVADK